LTHTAASFVLLAIAFSVLTDVRTALAQEPERPPDDSGVHLRVGPVTLYPTMALTNFGYDTNVFNQATDRAPKSDLTFTITPAVSVRLDAFRTQLVARVAEDLVWYQTYSSERAANNAVKAGWLIPFNRVSLKVNARHATLRDRPGYEIDARSQRTESDYDGLLEFRVRPKTFAGVSVQRQSTNYDKDAVFLDRNLQFELNRVTTGAGASLRYQLTPITSVSLTATHSQSRFEFSPLRDTK
jgi:hypothetical protein